MRALAPVLLAAALLQGGPAQAALEHEVKAAFLFKFLSYVEWPAQALDGPATPIVVGVMGDDEVHAALQEIVQGRVAQGHPVEVRRIRDGSAAGVHLLFVGKRAAGELRELSNRPGMVVVGDVEGALDRGAVINLLRRGDNVRFEVAPEAAERKGVKISSRMLAVAQHVKSEGP